jgi:hypothetical protein
MEIQAIPGWKTIVFSAVLEKAQSKGVVTKDIALTGYAVTAIFCSAINRLPPRPFS